jgi:hypothetical protein
MRPFVAGLVVAGFFSSQISAAEPCLRPAEKAAIDVSALKSELMVIALNCSAHDQYNAFINRYRPELLRHERVLNGLFGRMYGRRAERERDSYITNLANTEAEDGLKQGTDFCRQKMPLFDQVLALPSADALAGFASQQPLVKPISTVVCSSPNTASPRKTGKKTRAANN